MAKLGQHFLTDQGVLQDIARACGCGAGDSVLEIGPGRGALTAHLLASGAKVHAVEADPVLAAQLPGLLKSERLTVVDDDFLRYDLSALGAGPWLVAANLPYAVGTAILQKLLLWDAWTTATLMFQKEVALRVVAGTGGPDYGLLALSARLRADADLLFDIPPSAFRPRPQVDSAVVQLRRLSAPRVPAGDEPTFWRLAKAAFGQRRKMAASVLSKALQVPRPEMEAAFAAAGVDAAARPEDIPFEAWAALAAAFSRRTPGS